LRRAISYYDNIVEITDSPPEELPIWIALEKAKLVAIMQDAYPQTKPNA
jgi:hypothetical protein